MRSRSFEEKVRNRAIVPEDVRAKGNYSDQWNKIVPKGLGTTPLLSDSLMTDEDHGRSLIIRSQSSK